MKSTTMLFFISSLLSINAFSSTLEVYEGVSSDGKDECEVVVLRDSSENIKEISGTTYGKEKGHLTLKSVRFGRGISKDVSFNMRAESSEISNMSKHEGLTMVANYWLDQNYTTNRLEVYTSDKALIKVKYKWSDRNLLYKTAGGSGVCEQLELVKTEPLSR